MAEGRDIEIPNTSGRLDPRLDTPRYRQIRENARLRRTAPSAPPSARVPEKQSLFTHAKQGYRTLTGRR